MSLNRTSIVESCESTFGHKGLAAFTMGRSKGEQECGRDVRKNGISQQPMNENGIRFLRQERFWNLLLLEEEKIDFTLFLTVLYFGPIGIQFTSFKLWSP